MYIYIFTYIFIHMYTYIYIYIYTHIHISILRYIYICTYIYIYIPLGRPPRPPTQSVRPPLQPPQQSIGPLTSHIHTVPYLAKLSSCLLIYPYYFWAAARRHLLLDIVVTGLGLPSRIFLNFPGKSSLLLVKCLSRVRNAPGRRLVLGTLRFG